MPRENPFDRARNLSREVVEHTNGPPFPPGLYKDACRVKRIRELDMSIHGRLLPAIPDGYIIDINRNHPQEVKNYSVCHEMGHILLSEGIPVRIWPPGGDVWREAEETCERLAAELLMPYTVFPKDSRDCFPCFSSLESLASRYAVTPRAIRLRIMRLRIWNCALICWVPNDRLFPAGGFRSVWGKGNPQIREKLEKPLDGFSAAFHTYSTGQRTRDRFSGGLTVEFSRYCYRNQHRDQAAILGLGTHYN